jgi:predicted transcriptional regulator
MRAKPSYRDRDDTEVAVLDALADRPEDGMTVFELRAHVETDIDTLEGALAALKADDLIEATTESERTVIVVEDHVIGPEENGDEAESNLIDDIRRRLPF